MDMKYILLVLLLVSNIVLAEDESHCLVLAMYGEARGEVLDGKVAVANVILNRVKNRKFPNTICKVVLQKHQFESMKKLKKHVSTKSLPKMNYTDSNIYISIIKLADKILKGEVKDNTKGSTHFFAPIAQKALGRGLPKWALKLTYTTTIAKHTFYKGF
jgi:spore germination cell wall hydrolase CwlJ-like protein